VTAQASAEWLARGRNHQWQHRPVDAMLCFRRAVREDPGAGNARFHLGEVLWRLGRQAEAIAVWRDATEVAPAFPAVRQALAEALITTGDVAGAKDAADALLAADPTDARARAITAVAELSITEGEAAARSVADLVTRRPELLAAPSIAAPLAQAIERRADSPGVIAILDALIGTPPDAARVAAMPATLIALLMERLAVAKHVAPTQRQPWVAAVLARPWAAHDHDALRRVALATAALAPDQHAGLAQHYAALCERAEHAEAPLGWPRRTRGEQLRVVVLVRDGDGATDAARAQAVLNALPAARFAVVNAVIGVEAATISAGQAARIALPPSPSSADARRIAALDADAIVDLAGLTAPAGALLAQQPARTRLTIAGLRAPNVAPLIDRAFANEATLVADLEAMQSAIVNAGAATLDAAEMHALWERAVIAHRQGDRGAAREAYRQVLDAQPGFAPAHHLLGVALRDDGERDAARAEFGAALATAPGYTDARVDAIHAAVDAHDTAAAVALAVDAHAVTADPPPALLRALGSAALLARDGERAAAMFEAALAREPADGEMHYNHGVALQMQHRQADAARAYQRALAFRSDLVAADFNLGVIFTEQGNRDAAIAAFSNVIERNPRHVAAYKHLGELLFATGRIEAWRANFGRFEANCPDALPLAVQALEICQYHGEFERLEQYLDGLRRERFQVPDPHDLADSLEELLYLLLYFDVEPALSHRFSRTYETIARRVYGEPLPAREREPGKLRVGYLSADLRNHVMGKMIWQAVRHHDRARFQLFFYSMSDERDDWTREFEALGDRFEVVAGLSERAAAERIAAADLDVLIDLSTHTKGARPGILALKPARVQITHVASAGTLGLSTIDFKLTDRFADVPEAQSSQIESLLPMDGCVYPYRHIEPAQSRRLRRETFGLAADAVVIGAFVSGLKLSRRCLTLWREVLLRVPKAHLAFSPLNPALAPLYARQAGAAGIDASRILFVPQGADDAENQARYAMIDFVLDPMPYGGVNGTLEALDAEVPVVTLVGRRHAERTSYSILANLGVLQTVAHSGREYVDIAVRLATDTAFMRDVRAAIRAGLVDSALTDMPAHTRSLEAAYLEALAQKAPDALAAAASVGAQ
jgi:predicted O-linked N-acetylglucosamine transferase (SPINDLY family)